MKHESDFMDPALNEKTATDQNIGLTLNLEMSEMNCTETFGSSLSNNFSFQFSFVAKYFGVRFRQDLVAFSTLETQDQV